MNKVIATDLDGTLFYPKDRKNLIHGKNLYFLQSFIDRGGRVILVTGRSLDFGYKTNKKIGRDCGIIAYNGAAVYSDKKIIKQVTLPNKFAKEVIDWVWDRYQIPGVFIMTNKGLFTRLKYKNRFIVGSFKAYYAAQKTYAEKHDYTDASYNRELANGSIFKVMLYFGLGKKRRNLACEVTEILKKEKPGLEYVWTKNLIEITAHGTGKAKTLIDFCNDFKINKQDIYVIGDSGNDVSMFNEFYENSFCMHHAPQSVKEKAKYVVRNFEDLSRYIYKK